MTEKKTKVFFCITKGDWGGAQRYVYDLATSLPKDSYDTNVITGNGQALQNKLTQAGIKNITLNSLSRDINVKQDFLSLIELTKIFAKEKPDIVHLNSSKMGIIGALAARFSRVPKIIFTGHGWAFNEDRTRFQKKAIYFLHWLTIKLSHKTIAVSRATMNQLKLSKSLSSKIVVIKNGLDEINFLEKELSRQKIVEKLPDQVDTNNKLWVGCIAELHKNKGLKYLIEAMYLLRIELEDSASLPILIIIGEGERRIKLQERIDRYKLNDNIFLIGKIENASEYLSAFDIFTLTSITEALPYVILEAGQAGLPIVASGVGGIPEIIDDMNSGILVRPKEPEEIKKALSFILNNPDKMRLFGENIKQKVNSEFSKEKMVENTLALYKKI